MKLSVIVPTHRRADTLKVCLKHLEAQTVAADLEVLVVDDAGDDDVKRAVTHAKLDAQYLKIPPCHQGSARNRGVEKATGDRVLFIGDDIFLAPDACEKHLRARGYAMLGFITWDPAVGINKVMRWLEKTGWQFGYPMLTPYIHRAIPPAIQHRFSYTSHISVPMNAAKKFPFREDVSLYGWEDMEWGRRLATTKIPLMYEPDAKALHHHHMELSDSLKRMETLGRSAVVMESLAPELMLVPRGWKRFKYRLASLLPTMRGHHAKAFLAGIEGIRNY